MDLDDLTDEQLEALTDFADACADRSLAHAIFRLLTWAWWPF